MSIFRPKDGFSISLSDPVSQLIAQAIVQDPRVERYWGDLLERLKFTAHIEGEPDDRLGWGCRIFVAAGDPSAGRPRFTVIYRALGDGVRIKALRIT